MSHLIAVPPAEAEPVVVSLLTVVQHRILTEIRAYHAVHGFAPSIREVAEVAGLSTSGCWYEINQLSRKGWLKRVPGRPRALVVLDPNDGTDR